MTSLTEMVSSFKAKVGEPPTWDFGMNLPWSMQHVSIFKKETLDCDMAIELQKARYICLLSRRLPFFLELCNRKGFVLALLLGTTSS